jgi:predicted lipid-binding transport protein (Tim44 family)
MQESMIQGLGGFPVALVFFAGVALFLILRLRSILGHRIGFERPPLPPTAEAALSRAFLPPPTTARGALPDPNSPVGQRLAAIAARDRGFDAAKFSTQAEAAFHIIVTAFAEGDRAALKSLLNPHVYETFAAAISAREAAGQRQRTEVKSVISSTIEDAQLLGDTAAIVVRFVSDQVNLTQDAQGNALTGSEALTELTDVWTFERSLRSSDPTWRLAAARNG